MRERISAVISLNPWLCGRLNKKGDLEVNESDQNVDNYFIQLQDDSLSTSTNYLTLVDKVIKNVVKSGGDCKGKQEVLFKVTIIKCADDQYALILSISHTIADGYTYYEIYKMLSTDDNETY